MKIGDRVTLTSQSRAILGFKSDFEGKIIDILEEQPYPYVVNFPEMGDDHREFFDKEELIKTED